MGKCLTRRLEAAGCRFVAWCSCQLTRPCPVFWRLQKWVNEEVKQHLQILTRWIAPISKASMGRVCRLKCWNVCLCALASWPYFENRVNMGQNVCENIWKLKLTFFPVGMQKPWRPLQWAAVTLCILCENIKACHLAAPFPFLYITYMNCLCLVEDCQVPRPVVGCKKWFLSLGKKRERLASRSPYS